MRLDKGMQKSEIENAIKNCGDFVKIDHLTRLLKEKVPTDTRKFIQLKLGEIYERRFMFVDSAKAYEDAASCATTFAEQIKCYVKEAELLIMAGDFVRAEDSMKKAMVQANDFEKGSIYEGIKNFYKKQADALEKGNKRGNAVRIYEKLLEMQISDDERRLIKLKLVNLYEKLGKIREFIATKKSLEENRNP